MLFIVTLYTYHSVTPSSVALGKMIAFTGTSLRNGFVAATIDLIFVIKFHLNVIFLLEFLLRAFFW